MRLRPQGLRARSAAAFALLALLLSITLSVGTYQLARWYLLDQRETSRHSPGDHRRLGRQGSRQGQ